MTGLLDLPKEILSRIAYFLAPQVPCIPVGDYMGAQCDEIEDIKALRLAHSGLRNASAIPMSNCVYRHGVLNLEARRFVVQLGRNLCLRNVNHAHLSTEQPGVLLAPMYMAGLPNIKTVEVTDVHSEYWPDLMKALHGVASLRTLLVRMTSRWTSDHLVMDAPANPSFQLQQVTKLAAVEIGDMAYLDRLLQWLPRLEYVEIHTTHSCDGGNLQSVGAALGHCASTLKTLDIRSWQIVGAPAYGSAAVDLTHMQALEEVLVGALTTIAESPHGWIFPESVTRLYEDAFNGYPDDQPCTYANINALYQLLLHREDIAPGLQELRVRVFPGLSDTQMDFLGLVARQYHDAAIDLLLEWESEKDEETWYWMGG